MGHHRTRIGALVGEALEDAFRIADLNAFGRRRGDACVFCAKAPLDRAAAISNSMVFLDFMIFPLKEKERFRVASLVHREVVLIRRSSSELTTLTPNQCFVCTKFATNCADFGGFIADLICCQCATHEKLTISANKLAHSPKPGSDLNSEIVSELRSDPDCGDAPS
ncbi:hypothetical protein LP420_36495 [Massilia sp. B-10]|nr:hypothetical protein LP420_36495 [Massilia sp. B-10]